MSVVFWWLLLIVGMGLMVLEMFLPGFGLPGITGAICILASIYFISYGNAALALTLVVSVVAILGLALTLIVKSAKRGKVAKSPLVLDTVSTKVNPNAELSYYVGKKGIVKNKLRPCGIADIEGVRLNVLTDGEFVDIGAQVEVVRVEGSSLVVRKL